MGCCAGGLQGQVGCGHCTRRQQQEEQEKEGKRNVEWTKACMPCLPYGNPGDQGDSGWHPARIWLLLGLQSPVSTASSLALPAPCTRYYFAASVASPRAQVVIPTGSHS
jgi:hypothetical protein